MKIHSKIFIYQKGGETADSLTPISAVTLTTAPGKQQHMGTKGTLRQRTKMGT